MKLKVIWAVAAALFAVVSLAATGTGFSTNPAVVQSDVEIRGRILATGDLGFPEGKAAAIIAEPIGEHMYGVMAISEQVAVLGSTPSGTAINGITPGGTAVLGHAWGENGVGVIARNTKGGTALQVEGAIKKAFDTGNKITIYDDGGNPIGSWYFSFE